MRRWSQVLCNKVSWHGSNMFVFRPEMTPLLSPGMPCMLVTLLLLKYSSQIALSSGPSQNSAHSFVVTVTFSITSVFRQLSKLWFCSVRFPNMHTLCGWEDFHFSMNNTLVTVVIRWLCDHDRFNGNLNTSKGNRMENEERILRLKQNSKFFKWPSSSSIQK